MAIGQRGNLLDCHQGSEGERAPAAHRIMRVIGSTADIRIESRTDILSKSSMMIAPFTCRGK